MFEDDVLEEWARKHHVAIYTRMPEYQVFELTIFGVGVASFTSLREAISGAKKWILETREGISPHPQFIEVWPSAKRWAPEHHGDKQDDGEQP